MICRSARSRPRWSLVGVPLAAIALLTAACGGGGNGGGSGSAEQDGSQGPAAIKTAEHEGLGTILVDDTGRTLYLFEKDTKGSSTCSGDCADIWPPLMTGGKPTASGDIQASKLGTTSRDGGGEQVTYAGHPLYYYAQDGGPGDVNGQDLEQFGAGWYVLAPSGKAIEQEVESGSGGGGY